MGMSSLGVEGRGSIPQQNRDPLERVKGSVVISISKRVPWLRVFVEGVVIVGSILLAFGSLVLASAQPASGQLPPGARTAT